jgi:hypothetical protein
MSISRRRKVGKEKEFSLHSFSNPHPELFLFSQEGAGVDELAREEAPEEQPQGPIVDNIDPDAKGMAPTRRRRRRNAPVPATISEDTEAAKDTKDADEAEDRYSADDVYYMEPTPRKTDDEKKVEAVIVVREKGKDKGGIE